MRLLNVETMELEEYFGTQIPHYAILSHCWGEDEVTFSDINGPNWRGKRGAKKIESAASHCRRNSMRFIWIDTCCIDKSSSSELSEAINSMYLWYERSEVCYAYMEDVFLNFGEADDSHVELMIRRSKWFTRGWTLQELIASNRIFFLNRDWSILGITKRYWLNALGRAWQERCRGLRKGRQTREEDIAYCLLGIFEVNMPLLYGEGMRAFIRLQEEILKETDDQTLFAWGLTAHTPQTPFTNARAKNAGVLATSPSEFAGSRNIVPFPSKPDRQPFTMTNRGLRIELPLLNYKWHSPGSAAIAMLDCHHENDFSSVIGIYLESGEEDPIFTRDLGVSVYKILIGQAEKASVETVYIRKQQLTPKTKRTLKCIIRCESLESQEFQILLVSPKLGWNAETMVMELLPPSFERVTSSCSIVFAHRSKDISFGVTLRLVHDKKLVTIVPKPEGVGRDQWLEECAFNTARSSGFGSLRDHQPLTIQSEYDGFPSMTISAHAADKEILNQHVIILELEAQLLVL